MGGEPDARSSACFRIWRRYLTFPEIAGQLFITSHTVRSEAKAIYRKLDATSRTEAIDRAVDVGLLEPMFPHRASVAS